MSAICECPSPLLDSCSDGPKEAFLSNEFLLECFNFSTFLSIFGDPEAGKSLLTISIVLLASLLYWTMASLGEIFS